MGASWIFDQMMWNLFGKAKVVDIKDVTIESTSTQNLDYFKDPLQNNYLEQSINLLKEEWNADWGNNILYQENPQYKAEQGQAQNNDNTDDSLGRPKSVEQQQEQQEQYIRPEDAELADPNKSVIVERLKQNTQENTSSRYHIVTVKDKHGSVIGSAAYEIYKGDSGVFAQLYCQTFDKKFSPTEALKSHFEKEIFKDIGKQASEIFGHNGPVPVFQEVEVSGAKDFADKGWRFFDDQVNKEWTKNEGETAGAHVLQNGDYVYAIKNHDSNDITMVSPQMLQDVARHQREHRLNIPCGVEFDKLDPKQQWLMKDWGAVGEKTYFKNLDLEQNLTVSKNSPVAEKAPEEKQEKPSSFLSGHIVARGCTAMARAAMNFKDACLGRAS